MIDEASFGTCGGNVPLGSPIFFDGTFHCYGVRCFVRYLDAFRLMHARRVESNCSRRPEVLVSYPSPTAEQRRRMTHYGITSWAHTYSYGGRGFDKLQDAILKATLHPVGWVHRHPSEKATAI